MSRTVHSQASERRLEMTMAGAKMRVRVISPSFQHRRIVQAIYFRIIESVTSKSLLSNTKTFPDLGRDESGDRELWPPYWARRDRVTYLPEHCRYRCLAVDDER